MQRIKERERELFLKPCRGCEQTDNEGGKCQSGLISKASAHNPVLVVRVPAGGMLS